MHTTWGKFGNATVSVQFVFVKTWGGFLWRVIWISDPTSRGSWRIKGTEESTLVTDSSVLLMHYDPSDVGSLILITQKERTLGERNHMIMVTSTFLENLCFQNAFCPHDSEQLAFSNSSGLKNALGKLRFCDGLV